MKDVVDDLRARGEQVGLLQIRSFRPLPSRRIRAALRRAEIVAVLDRADSPGGRLHSPWRSARPLPAPRRSSAATSTGSAAASCTRRTSRRSSAIAASGLGPRYLGLRGEPCHA